MKTNYIINRKLSMYSLLGFVAFLAASCGSYQNSSYYDSDGIYHPTGKPQNAQAANNPSQGNQYKDYFSSLQNDDTQIFTDVNSYNTPIDTTVQNTQEYYSGNAGWGESASNITVNIGAGWGYGMWNNYWYSPYWGYNSWYGPGWGWGIGWYGPNWGFGWGYPYYGYGYGGYYPNYGYGNHYYSYNGGRRGSSYANGTRNNSVRSYSTNGGRSYTSYNNGGRRNSPTFTGTRSTTSPRYSTSTRSYPQQNNTGVRQSNSQPTRSYSPNTSSGGRSSGGSYGGGGGSYGGGGGGRSGGGGGRR